MATQFLSSLEISQSVVCAAQPSQYLKQYVFAQKSFEAGCSGTGLVFHSPRLEAELKSKTVY